jgi:hypothetical protein
MAVSTRLEPRRPGQRVCRGARQISSPRVDQPRYLPAQFVRDPLDAVVCMKPSGINTSPRVFPAQHPRPPDSSGVRADCPCPGPGSNGPAKISMIVRSRRVINMPCNGETAREMVHV